MGERERQKIQGWEGAFDRLGQSWTHLLEAMGKGALYDTAVAGITGFSHVLDSFILKLGEVDKIIEEHRSKMAAGEAITIMGIEVRKESEDFKKVRKGLRVVVPIPPPRTVEEAPKVKSLTPSPPSRFNKALIDINIGLKRSLVDLNSEEIKLRQGYNLLSPEVLKLAERHKVLDETVKILEGDFRGLNDEGLKIAYMVRETNDALLDLERRKEADAIFNETRTALEKYNIELQRVIFPLQEFLYNC